MKPRARPKPRSKPTIATVAQRARVAPMTVSRVLNGGYVSAEARARVEKAIADLAYVPSATARSLKYGRAGSIGLVVESVHGPWFMGLLAGIEQELAKTRTSVMLGGLIVRGVYDASTIFSWIGERRIDGLVFARYTNREAPLLAAAREAKIPATFICPDEAQPTGFTVRCRNFDAGRSVGRHLVELGHEQIGIAAGPRDSVDSLDRVRGVKEQLKSYGLSVRTEDLSFGASYASEAGQDAAIEYLRRPEAQRPTAMVLGNDVMALAFMSQLMRAGLSVPRDVSVVGFDGIDEAERFWPPLTTAAQPLRELGAAACKALLELIEDPSVDRGTTIEYAMELVTRDSTGEPPTHAAKKKKRSKSAAPAAG